VVTLNRSAGCEDRGDTTGVAHGCLFDSIDTISFVSMIKREKFIPELWNCGSNLY
jgi:hypothetical protein